MIKTNDEAELTLSELPGQLFTGRVDRTAGAIDPVSRTLRTEILVANPGGKLLPGAHAMVRVKLANAEEPVIVPVNTLLFRNEQGMQAGVVDAQDIVHLTSVKVGRDFGTTVEIVHGLAESDRIILNPSDSLESGLQVQVVAGGTNTNKTAHD
jgi:multidrug efflux pump subunit AcrA (membrane-fusion protein)